MAGSVTWLYKEVLRCLNVYPGMEIEGVRPLLAIKLLSHKAASLRDFVLRNREHELAAKADVCICILGPKHRGALNKQHVPSAEGHLCSMRWSDWWASGLQRAFRVNLAVTC